MQLFNGNGDKLSENDNWRDASNASEISDTGIPPKHDAESAILMPLSGGSYTAIVKGAGPEGLHGTGNAVVEVYRLD